MENEEIKEPFEFLESEPVEETQNEDVLDEKIAEIPVESEEDVIEALKAKNRQLEARIFKAESKLAALPERDLQESYEATEKFVPKAWAEIDHIRVASAIKNLTEEEVDAVFDAHPGADAETILRAIKNPQGDNKAAQIKADKISKHLRQSQWGKKVY